MILLLIGVLIVAGCGRPPDATTPEGAFAKIGPCIDQVDRECLFNALERDSRWSLFTIHRTLVDIRKVVETSYPPAERANAYGLFKEEAAAPTPEKMFALFCRKRKCMEQVARGFGAIRETRPISADEVEITTIRGNAYRMVRADDRWGLDILGDELQQIKLRVIDRLEQVRENARQFDEQKRAREGAVHAPPQPQ